MGLMFSRRRAEDKKHHDSNKAKAHAENHKKVLEEQKAKAQKSEEKSDGSDKPRAK